MVETIASLTERIRHYERRIEQLCKESYPQETGLLRQVPGGVGALTSLTFVLRPWRTRGGSPKAAQWVLTWAWCLARTNPARVTLASESPGRAMRC